MATSGPTASRALPLIRTTAGSISLMPRAWALMPPTSDVFLTVSHDHGKTWSAPVRVNDDATQTDQWMPSVAVTEEGTVGVMFYDRRNDPGANLNIDVYL